MSGTLVGALVTAGILGVTHAIEPDHVAGIASLTSRYGDSRLSALVGACFSLGHVALVVLWLAVGHVLLRRTEFPDVFETIGAVSVSVLLGVLGAILLLGGLRRFGYAHSHEHEHDTEIHSHEQDRDNEIHSHEHDHDGGVHNHAHAHLPVFGDRGHDADAHAHDHTVRAYLRTGVIGALFTLSPPVSMIAFTATLFPTTGPETVVLAVVAYGVAITATMSALGAGVGAAFGRSAERDVRVYGGAQALAGVVTSDWRCGY